MIETIEYKNEIYPKFQASGHASRFIENMALEVCKGNGLDIGCGRVEWALRGSRPVDISFDDGYHANNLPNAMPFGRYDYIFSSHCLEHIPDWMKTLDYWLNHIRSGGVIFLYLPNWTQSYWSYGNSKHVNIFAPELIEKFMINRELKKIFVGNPDLNQSFAAMAEIP